MLHSALYFKAPIEEIENESSTFEDFILHTVGCQKHIEPFKNCFVIDFVEKIAIACNITISVLT